MNLLLVIYIVSAVLVLAALVIARKQIARGLLHGIPSVYRIAGMTFAETRRRRILQVIILLAALMLVGMLGITWLNPGESAKALVSGGLDLVFLLGILVSIFICAFLIPSDIDKRTIYSVLSKPVHRWEFVVGKYFGALAVVGLLVGIMLLVQMIVLVATQKHPIGLVFQAGLVAYFGIAVFTAAVMVVSTIASSLTTVIAGFTLWLVGSIQAMSHSVIAHIEGGFSKTVLGVVSAIIPHLDKYDFRVEAAEQLAIPLVLVQRGLVYGIGYVAVCLIIASLLFRERQV
ncbi:MAG: hypothetical protein GTO55_02075 [Armatimonadetes bacterium]|nr:hypothetical protein [Armatimonadota bacterium]NIM23066.1 hypothetical protein [Armatimonadota bacterium]NIM66934.1 hypothetical protein [Armatimonadota bacterium]NIM75468.1 hypothetical protein [Armatimonadota bacterium]NIN05125.1 hypothetical protein [Armatimonadota bacterium]